MIRRLLSLAYGVVVFWVGYALVCNAVFQVAPVDMVLLCANGLENFYQALTACLIPVAAMILLLSRLPFVKRLWANLGSIACGAAIMLFCLLFMGAAISGTGGPPQ